MQSTTTTIDVSVNRAAVRADGFSGANIASLLLGHCAGMLDLVGLPVWVGANLIGFYQFDPQKAGLLATVFLLCAVVVVFSIMPAAPKTLYSVS